MDGHEFSKMDKNKSAHKLKGLPSIYWLNLDADEDRRFYMEEQFKYWEIENHTRIAGYDAREDDPSEHLKGKVPDNVSPAELGCCMSHLKAIKYFYEETDDEYCMILEDDVDFSTVKYWNFTWNDFYAHFPYDYDVVQLAIICTGDLHVRLHKRFVNDFSTACYVISRYHAEKLVRLHCRDDKYKLDQGVKPRPVADDLIYNSGNSFAIPLFLYKVELGSSIHPDHVEVFHKANQAALMNYWQQQGASIDITEYMNYDPYLGRITEPTQKREENPTA